MNLKLISEKYLCMWLIPKDVSKAYAYVYVPGLMSKLGN